LCRDRRVRVSVAHCFNRMVTQRIGNTMRRFSSSAAKRRSWVNYDEASNFPVQNIPFGVFSSAANGPRCATAIGNKAVDLTVLADAGLLSDLPFNASAAFRQPTLNAFMGLDRKAWVATRARLQELLAADGDDRLQQNKDLCAAALRPFREISMHLPAKIGDYTDFYASREHATNVGIMFRGRDNALQPNWLHLPVGYHGRASSVVVSGTPIARPRGQVAKDKSDQTKGSIYSDCKLLDYELEMGVFVGGNLPPLGRPIKVEEAEDYIFGYVILNDWSARDIQPWEYVPLGPFTAKNFATTISPWVITPEALEPFVCPTSAVVQTDPEVLPYLRDPNYTSYDLKLAVDLETPVADGTTVTTIAETNFKHMYWTARQMLAHHSVTGCSFNPGDLYGSGTISGTIDNSEGKSINYGSLLEQCWRGSNDIPLKDGGTRKFIRDGDNVIMHGHCQGDGFRIGFGECAGVILPAGSFDSAPTKAAEGSSASMKDIVLSSYWRSSCSWRVRIALAYHGVAFENKPVYLVEGKQHTPEYLEHANGMGQVPSFTFTDETGEHHTVTQSLAIIDLLDSMFGGTRNGYLVPPADGTTAGALLRSRALQIAEVVNSGTQPLQNLSVMKSVKVADVEGQKVDGKGFATAALSKGMAVCEKLVGQAQGHFAAGNALTVADVCLVPQLYNARRFGIDLSQYPNLLQVEAACSELPCFKVAHPDSQPDAQPA